MKKLLILCALITFSYAHTANANGSETEIPSYSKKKSGGVPFTSKSKPVTDEQIVENSNESATNEENLADIEPAAGAYDDDEKSDDLSKSMKLPRK